MMLDFGWGNGYVLLPPGHKYHGVHYDNIPVEVHGGLTHSDLVTENDWEEIPKECVGWWCVGFDTVHYQDSLERWPKELVEQEAMLLMENIK